MTMSSAAIDERRRAIVALLASRGWLTVEEVATDFAISPMTARRDFDQLERDGALTRRHGGAVATERVVRRVGPRHPQPPSRLLTGAAAAVAAQVRPDHAVFLDDSAIARATASAIVARGVPCTLLTNALDVMAATQRERGGQAPVGLIGICGRLDRDLGAFVGMAAVAQVRRHFADLAVLGDRGRTDAAEAVRVAMAEQSASVISQNGRDGEVVAQRAAAETEPGVARAGDERGNGAAAGRRR